MTSAYPKGCCLLLVKGLGQIKFGRRCVPGGVDSSPSSPESESEEGWVGGGEGRELQLCQGFSTCTIVSQTLRYQEKRASFTCR